MIWTGLCDDYLQWEINYYITYYWTVNYSFSSIDYYWTYYIVDYQFYYSTWDGEWW
jgi:hypothetical protein